LRALHDGGDAVQIFGRLSYLFVFEEMVVSGLRS
jgi:hypothetical protein